MQTVTTIGLDIAKSVFQVHGVDAAGQVVIRRQLKRRHVLSFFEKVLRPLPLTHPVSRELAHVGIPKIACAESAVSIPSAIPTCPSPPSGQRRTDPPATGPSIFLPGGALADPSSSKYMRWMPPVGSPAASRTRATMPGASSSMYLEYRASRRVRKRREKQCSQSRATTTIRLDCYWLFVRFSGPSA